MRGKILSIAGAAIVTLHGLVHLLGLGVYWQLFEVEGLAFKTTLLGGSVDLGQLGIQVFGGLWVLAAAGFAIAAAGLVTHRDWARQTLLAAALLSLVITGLEWDTAYAGVIVNLVILAMLWISTRARDLGQAGVMR